MTEVTSSNSISSVETDGSTLNETNWPGTLEAVNNNAPVVPRCDAQIASESLRDMIQALGSEKMAKIRSLIAVHQRNSRISLPSPRPSDSSGSPVPISSSSNSPEETPERPTDEVALTICDLESALGPEDMSELRSSMISVRRQSVHLDVWISSDMTEEELQQSVEAVKTRQDEVLELIFQEIMGLIATKLGIELDLDLQAPEPVKTEAEVMAMTKSVKRDESNMLKVPEVDLTGRRASTSTQKSAKKKETKKKATCMNRSQGPFNGSFYSRTTPGGIIPAKVESGNSRSKDEFQEKKKKKRGCLGFCTVM